PTSTLFPYTTLYRYELMDQLRETRHNRALALEDGRHDDAQDFLDRQEALERQLERLRTGWDRATSPTVMAEDIAEVVSMWTGVRSEEHTSELQSRDN